jgi:cytochrome c-type biogenesis protein CcsB
MNDTAPRASALVKRNIVIRFFSNVWLGIVLLALIVIYSSVISALPPVRWAIEVTEMQAFRHWLFVTLVVLFILSLVTATLVKAHWNRLGAGTIVAHLGLVLLVGGAWAYFGTKIEGQVLLQSPSIAVRAAGPKAAEVIGRFRAAQGETWERMLPVVNQPLTLQVVATEPRGVDPVAAVRLAYQIGDEQPHALDLAANSDAWQPINQMLSVRLETTEPQSVFYDDESPVLYVRDLGRGTDVLKRIQHLPIHREHYLPGDGDLANSRGEAVPSKRLRPEVQIAGLTIPTGWFEPWRMPIDVDADGLPFSIQITGYVPYIAGMQPMRSAPDSGPSSRPILEVRERRRPDIAPRSRSAIRLQFTGKGEYANWSRTEWCMFSSFADADAESRPVRVNLPGSGGTYELIYSRARYALGATLAARKLSVTYFPGERGIETYRSDVLVQDADGVVRPATVSTNQTLTIGHWTLFQSGFDGDDHWRYSILGVGNRLGIWPMNIGWIVVALGCVYAFYVKPTLLRRVRTAVPALLLAVAVVGLGGCESKAEPFQASRNAAAIAAQVNWKDAQLLTVQDAGRYKTLEAFARESFAAMTGKEHLPGLPPVASVLEWVFNSDAYADTPLLQVKEVGLRSRLTEQLGDEKRQRILNSPYFTPRELHDPSVNRMLGEVETEPMARRAANRVRMAQSYADNLSRMIALVPQPGGDRVSTWFTPPEVVANLSDEQLEQIGLARQSLPPEYRQPAPGVSPDQALAVTVNWSGLRAAWLHGDAPGVQTYLNRLVELLPTLAGPGVYPTAAQRVAEVRYYRLGKFTGGWLLYFVAFLFSIWGAVTRWKVPFVVTIALLIAGLAWHGYGLSLRWYILGRIPVANMFEAVTASAFLAITVSLIIELTLKVRYLLVGASALGFLALVIAGYALPGAELSTMMGILDHVQLRIHTVLISFSYSLIFVAAVVAMVYLIGYYSVRARQRAGWTVALADAGGARVPTPLGVSLARPWLAGGSPGDEAAGRQLPQWLNNIDWSHLIILNLVFVMLFVGGVIMGAVWANQSWGRPWGWDPKEVFALNTWLIYAILIHVRLVVRNRGLWTAWLSIIGCGMMAFNWFFVNFFINSIHSYA